MASEILLQLKDISVHYGGVQALRNVSLEIDEGEIVALMGPNGAGKSTILKAIFGLVPISGGQFFWHNKKILPVSHEVITKGISFVPQGRRVFANLTVAENLEMAGITVRDKKELKRRMEESLELFPILKEKFKAKSKTLSGGQQQMLALARGLMTDPRLLLLDEPSLGLAPKVVKEIFRTIKRINEYHKTAIIVVEHNIKSLLEITGRAYVLDKGEVVAQDNPKKIIEGGVLEKVFMGR
ncbi:ABC transporter ATP-binding protein [Candidatus Uhrbacteria bacterium]|nr:ABC transporter ATP-binding protein [Candidatus Uhrbacteria bacterium]